MQILYVTGREHSYTRNDVLLRAWQRLGTVDITGHPRAGSLLWNSLRSSGALIVKLLKHKYDLVFVGFYGHLLMLPTAFLSRQPVLFDAFISTFDTLCFDRRVFSPSSLPGRLAFWLDQASCRLASRVLLDTPDQVDYFVRTFRLDPAKVAWLPVGCNEDIFFPRPVPAHRNQIQVLYYCSYQPLHGVETVVRAAAQLCAESGLHLTLIGEGPDLAKAKQLALELSLDNITFRPNVSLLALAGEIASADICLGGPFGSSDKAGRVIPGKIYQILAMERPVIAADTVANKSLLTQGQTGLLCPPGSPQALAEAILQLYRDQAFRQNLASAGYQLYLERCSERVITAQLRALVEQMRSTS